METPQIVHLGNKSLKNSGIVLVIVVLLTLGIWLYNNSLVTKTEKINTEKQTIAQSIEASKKDPDIVVYSLIQANKKSLEILQKRSKVSDYIKGLRRLALKYKFVPSGFNLSSGKLSTQVLSESGDNGLAYKLTRDFIKEYRNDEEAIFELGFINSIEGYDSMKYSINLEIK